MAGGEASSDPVSPIASNERGPESDSFGTSPNDYELQRAIASLTITTADLEDVEKALAAHMHGPHSDDVDQSSHDSQGENLGSPGDSGSCSNLIVNYLPASVGEQELKEIFAPHGNLQHVKVVLDRATGSSMGYGFVKFATDEEAAAAVAATNGLSIGKKRIKVSVARPSCKDIKRSKLYITNLPEGLGKDEVVKLFQPFGNIIECRTLSDKRTGASRCTAFVQYDRRSEAQQALALNGTELPGSKRPLLVKFAEDHHRRRGGTVKGTEGFPLPSPGGRSTPGNPQGGQSASGAVSGGRRHSHSGANGRNNGGGGNGNGNGGNGMGPPGQMPGMPLVFSPIVPLYGNAGQMDTAADYIQANAMAMAAAAAAYTASPQRMVTSATPPYSPSAFSPQAFSPQSYGPGYSPQGYGGGPVGFPSTPGNNGNGNMGMPGFPSGTPPGAYMRGGQQLPLQMPSFYYGNGMGMNGGMSPGLAGRGMPTAPAATLRGGNVPQGAGNGGSGSGGGSGTVDGEEDERRRRQAGGHGGPQYAAPLPVLTAPENFAVQL